jgi:hypothetical protein
MNPVRQGIYQKLTTASSVTALVGSRVYHAQAPADASYPFIVFQKQSRTKTRAFGANAFERETWLVKAIDRNSTSNLAESIAAAIDSTLDLGTITVSGKTLCDLHHVSDVEYLEEAGDQQFRHHGSLYAVVTTS